MNVMKLPKRKGLRWSGRKIVRTWRDPLPWASGASFEDVLEAAGYSKRPLHKFGEEYGWSVDVFNENEGPSYLVQISDGYRLEDIAVRGLSDLVSMLAEIVPAVEALERDFVFSVSGSEWEVAANVELVNGDSFYIYDPEATPTGIRGSNRELVPWTSIARVTETSFERRRKRVAAS